MSAAADVLHLPDAAEMRAITELRRVLLANGYQPVAVASGGKAPVARNWPSLRGVPAADAAGLNTGVLSAGLRAADVDVDDAEEVARIVATVSRLAGACRVVRSRPNSPRVLLLYRAPEGMRPPKRTMRVRGGTLEILGAGQQFVAYGRHPSGVEFEWLDLGLDLVPLHDLPVMTAEAEAAICEALELRDEPANVPRSSPLRPSPRRPHPPLPLANPTSFAG